MLLLQVVCGAYTSYDASVVATSKNLEKPYQSRLQNFVIFNLIFRFLSESISDDAEEFMLVNAEEL